MNILICADINPNNQYIQLLSESYQKKGHQVVLGVDNFFHSNFKPDFIHLHWPEVLFNWRNLPETDTHEFDRVSDRLRWYFRNHIPIVSTLHNIRPHDNSTQIFKSIYDIIYQMSRIIVHHGKASIDIFRNTFPENRNAVHIICPHGPYPATSSPPEEARKKYGIPINRFVLLNFGQQRHYKGSFFTRRVFAKWRKKKTFLFTIGPKPNSKFHHSRLIPLLPAPLRTAISFLFSFPIHRFTNRLNIVRTVPQDETPKIIATSDILFLGHSAGLTSGLLSLAASYRKPVVYPDIGNFNEQLSGWEWSESYTVGDVDSAINALDNIYEKVSTSCYDDIDFNNEKWLNFHSWDKHVDNIMDAVKKLERQFPLSD